MTARSGMVSMFVIRVLLSDCVEWWTTRAKAEFSPEHEAGSRCCFVATALSINDHSSLPLGENIVWIAFCLKIKKKKERNNPKKCFHELTFQISHLQTKMKGMWCPTQWKLEENSSNYITKNIFQLEMKKSHYIMIKGSIIQQL